MKARIVIGANYGDEGKGTVTARLTKEANGTVLNVLTNGGAQRGHSILTKDGSITFQHFGSGTYHGADNYYSRFFILNPMQFVKEYNSLIVKPNIFRDKYCKWSTPFDMMANHIEQENRKMKASCRMGIWNTIKRYHNTPFSMPFDDFITKLDQEERLEFLNKIKKYYESLITIPDKWKDAWNGEYLKEHFIADCMFMFNRTYVWELSQLPYDNLIFENGQGLLLSDIGKDSFDTTPSLTGIEYSKTLLKELNVKDITAHYVTRPYLTRHGAGLLEQACRKETISSSVNEDRTNHYNEGQGEFRFGLLDINALRDRIIENAGDVKFELDVTHCDEMDRISEFKKIFSKVNTYDNPLI